MIENLVYALARGPATWEGLLAAVGAHDRGRRLRARQSMQQLVRQGLVIEPGRPSECYRLAK